MGPGKDPSSPLPLAGEVGGCLQPPDEGARARGRFVTFLATFLLSSTASAATVHLPYGGRSATILAESIICGALPSGWGLERDRRTVRAPAIGSQAPRTVEARVAPELDACDRTRATLTLVATSAPPEIDLGGVVFAPDEGRLELEGRRLKGVTVRWKVPTAEGDDKGPREGSEVCLAPTGSGGRERCVLPLPARLPLATVLTWLPAGATLADDARVFDLGGAELPEPGRTLRPALVLVAQVVPAAATVDVSLGPARVPLSHPGAVAAVDCGQARCELTDDAILVRSVPAPATSLSVRLRLAPRIRLHKPDGTGPGADQVTLTLPLVQCPITVVSGAPVRDAVDTRIVVKVDPRCAREGERARWTINGEAAHGQRPKRVGEALFVVLEVGQLSGERAVIAARRPDIDAALIGSVTTPTIAAPRPRVSLELPKHGKVEFIPTNRDAVLTVAGAPPSAALVPLPIEGAYSVRAQGGHYLLRGDENAGGFVALRFGYRALGLPPELGTVDLALLSERVQRAVREASVPAPFSTGTEGAEALVELLCAGENGATHRVPPARLYKLDYDVKDTCRLVIHRERLPGEYGLQEVLVEVEVTRAEGGRRGEASFSDRLILVPGGEPRVIPLKGGTEEFDRILVRLSHVLDETRYALSPTGRQGIPSVQWPLAIEGGRLRLYATAAIPAGLYRINKPSGQLTLNFGVLSRITWLDDRGKEGLFGAEVGLMGMGLIQRPGAIEYPLTFGAVAGLGIRVPLGGGAAVGVHVWGAYEFRDDFEYKNDPRETGTCPGATSCRTAPRVAFIFGPSISIGNVGTNL